MHNYGAFKNCYNLFEQKKYLNLQLQRKKIKTHSMNIFDSNIHDDTIRIELLIYTFMLVLNINQPYLLLLL